MRSIRVLFVCLALELSTGCGPWSTPVVSYSNDIGTASAVVAEDSVVVYLPLDSSQIDGSVIQWEMEYRRWVLGIWRGDRGGYGISFYNNKIDAWSQHFSRQYPRDPALRLDNGVVLTFDVEMARRFLKNRPSKLFFLTKDIKRAEIRVEYPLK